MRNANKNRFCVWCLLFMGIISFLGLSCANRPPSGRTAIKVNDYSLTAEEFNALFSEINGSEGTPKEREQFLDNLIMRKLLLQEGQREALDKQKDFMRSIENFWEQSLLKIVVDKKIKEISSSVTVSDKELQDYYDKWTQENPGATKTFDEIRKSINAPLLKKKQTAAINAWIDDLRKKADIEVDKKAIGIK